MKRPQACVERLLGIYKYRIPFLPRPSRFWWLGADDCKYFLLYLFRIYLIFKVPPLATQDSARYLRDYESYQLRTSYSTWPYGRPGQHLHRWRWQFQVMLLSSRLLKPAFCVDSDSELREDRNMRNIIWSISIGCDNTSIQVNAHWSWWSSRTDQ